MSLVGTRPPTVDEWEKYELHHRSRMSTKPGITGMWQVSGRSDITDFEEVVRLNTEYIQNWTIGLDIRILIKTVLAVEESYGYLTGSYVRDKDGVNGACMICEMFSYYATKGIGLLDKLDELYRMYLLWF